MLDLAVESNRNKFQVPPPTRGLPMVRTERRLPLLKDRSIIDFVSAYTEQHWPKVRCVHAVYSSKHSSGLGFPSREALLKALSKTVVHLLFFSGRF